MQRVATIGSAGTGKSTLASRLGEITGIPVVHLDALYWQPGWQEPDKDAFHEGVRALARGERWIIDGNYSASLPERFERADTIIFLDLPRWLCMWRITRRVLRNYGRTRLDMADGCNERFDLEFMKWVWNWPQSYRTGHLERIYAYRHRRRIEILASQVEVDRFLTDLCAEIDPAAC